MTYRIRVDLDGAQPPIWRRLELRSDLTLDVVHEVLQAAYAWTDSHLHRFALGGNPFDPRSELFLCPYDVEEGDDEDEGVPPPTYASTRRCRSPAIGFTTSTTTATAGS